MKIALEDFLPCLPQILGDGSNGAEPTAKSLAEEKRHRKEREQQKHRGGVNSWNLATQEPILQVHQPCDWQPAFHSRGSSQIRVEHSLFKLPHPEIKFRTQP